ncbi:hypothetical protein DBV15_12287 [Temnothorax longispinosus]|uniref:Uncharacterized protein n=1 Tax=Temnothorax longispinosus TaxID=300112 RepID=A0A4S2KMV2_9HYME|nr:hypothetical protein DBV15_12287 [Temnothorax longispinosus]
MTTIEAVSEMSAVRRAVWFSAVLFAATPLAYTQVTWTPIYVGGYNRYASSVHLVRSLQLDPDSVVSDVVAPQTSCSGDGGSGGREPRVSLGEGETKWWNIGSPLKTLLCSCLSSVADCTLINGGVTRVPERDGESDEGGGDEEDEKEELHTKGKRVGKAVYERRERRAILESVSQVGTRLTPPVNIARYTEETNYYKQKSEMDSLSRRVKST